MGTLTSNAKGVDYNPPFEKKHHSHARSFLLVLCLQDTRSHSTLLGDIGAGMMSSASCRRHATRAEAEEAFGTQLPSKRSVVRYVLHPPMMISSESGSYTRSSWNGIT